MKFIWKGFFCSLILCISFVAQAAMEWPPEMPSPTDRAEYFDAVLEKYPWTSSYHTHFETFFQNLLRAKQGMAEITGAPQAIEARPPLLYFKILKATQKEVRGFSLSADFSGQVSQFTGYSDVQLADCISKILQNKGRFQGALTAVLRSARGISKQVFAAGHPTTQISLLLQNVKAIDTEELLENFRFEDFGFAEMPRDVGTILNMMRDLVGKEESARFALLGFIARSKENHKLDYESLQDFREDAENALDQLSLTNSKVRSIFIDQVAKQSFVESQVMANSSHFETAYSIQELSVFPALFRGCVGGDCSTSQSYIFPASPFERVFLVKTSEGPIGYISGTTIRVDEKPTFYMRDVAIPNMSGPDSANLLAAFYQIRQELGVEQIALATSSVLSSLSHNSYIRTEIRRWADPNLVRLTYNPVDVQIRAQVLERISSASYDSVQKHSFGHLMAPRSKALETVQVEFLDGKGNEFLPPEKLDKAALYQALQIGIMEPTLAKRRVHPNQFESFQVLCHAMANIKHLNLEEYYKNIDESLKPFELNLSQHLIKDWRDLFAKGHLLASDAMSSASDAFERHTVDFVLELILRSGSADEAYALIAKNVKDFETSEKFLKMLNAQLNPADPSKPPRATVERLQRLHKAGIVFHRALKLNDAEIDFLAEQGYGEAKAEKLRQRMTELSKKKKLTEEELLEVSSFLDSEHVEDEGPSVWALEMLAIHKPKNKQIQKELYNTFRYDDNISISMTAALLFLQLADAESEAKYVDRAAKKLLKHKDDKELSSELKKKVQDWVTKHQAKDAESCEDLLTKPAFDKYWDELFSDKTKGKTK